MGLKCGDLELMHMNLQVLVILLHPRLPSHHLPSLLAYLFSTDQKKKQSHEYDISKKTHEVN